MRIGILLAILPAFMLTGCGVLTEAGAKNTYEGDVARYHECLSEHANRRDCEGYRLNMEASERRYSELNAALHAGTAGGTPPW